MLSQSFKISIHSVPVSLGWAFILHGNPIGEYSIAAMKPWQIQFCALLSDSYCLMQNVIARIHIHSNKFEGPTVT